MSFSALAWKEEPVSPSSYDETSLFDVATPYQSTPFEHYNVKLDSEFDVFETKAELASHILENLDNLMDLDELIKDEPFLLDDKILPTILDEVEPHHHLKSEYSQHHHEAQYLLKEFDTIYNVVEMDHDTLTPPQSPPGQLTTLQPLLPSEGYLGEFAYPPAAATPQPDIAHELAVVEELVRTRVQDMQWSPGSPTSSSNGSNFEDSSSEDPEWVPEPIWDLGADTSSRKRSTRNWEDSSSEDAELVGHLGANASSKKRSTGKPEEKRVRKKEQNKNAATRYRMKKKAEVEEILQEEKQMLSANKVLGERIADLQREIKCLKGLMRDLFKAKGIIN